MPGMIPLPDFVDRVLTTRERIQFSFADPYGHLNSAKYLELMLNHRLHAADEQLSCHAMDIAKKLGIGFATATVDLRFVSPCRVGEWVELASWVSTHDTSGFTLSLIMVGEKSRKVKATAEVRFASINLSSNASCPMPEALPTRAQAGVITERPEKRAYLATIQASSGGAP